MNIEFDLINWIAVIVCFVVGQVYLTLWFVVFFGNAWAKAYDPAKTKKEHTAEVPGWTYAIGAICTFLVVMGLAILQSALGVATLSGALGVALFVSVMFVLATTIPGYAFLRRWNALLLALSSQVTLIFILSIILALWK